MSTLLHKARLTENSLEDDHPWIIARERLANDTANNTLFLELKSYAKALQATVFSLCR